MYRAQTNLGWMVTHHSNEPTTSAPTLVRSTRRPVNPPPPCLSMSDVDKPHAIAGTNGKRKLICILPIQK